MIEIPRRIIRQIRDIVRRTLAVTSSKPLVVLVESGNGGLTLRVHDETAAVQYRFVGEFDVESFAVPYDFLADCEGGKDQPVVLERVAEGQISAQWNDGDIPQLVRYDAADASNNPPFPDLPTEMTANEPGIIAALADAMATTDPGSVRYALGCVQFCGDSGRIAASDGRQLYVKTELQFGFNGRVLVPRNTVFQSKMLPTDQPVSVGLCSGWIAFVVGPWTISLKLLEEGKFPDVDSIVNKQDIAISSARIHRADAVFLQASLKRLPGSSEAYKPITVDLNGQVAVRAQDARQQVTELRLSNSTRSGEPTRFTTNRDYLSRAMRMGFGELQVFGKGKQVQCTDGIRTYLWAVLEAEEAIKTGDDAIIVESPAAGPDQRSDTTQSRRKKSMARARPPENAQPAKETPQQTATNGDDVIQRAETLRTSLRETLQHTTTLLADLKRQRKQNKALRSTLASLRELQAVDV